MKNRKIYFAIIAVILIFNYIKPIDHYINWRFGERLNTNRELIRMAKVDDVLLFGTSGRYIFYRDTSIDSRFHGKIIEYESLFPMKILKETDDYSFPLDSISNYSITLIHDYTSNEKTARMAYYISDNHLEPPYEIPVNRALTLIDSLSK